MQLRVRLSCWFDLLLVHFRYGVCSRRKSFATMTPAAKENWVFRLQAEIGVVIRIVFVEARNCKVEFPCRGLSSICCRSALCHVVLQQDGTSARNHIQLLALRIGLPLMGGCHAQRLLIMLGFARRFSSGVFFNKLHKYQSLSGEGFAWSLGYHGGREDKPGREMSISLAMRWLDSCSRNVCCLLNDVLVFLCRGSVCTNYSRDWWRCRP